MSTDECRLAYTEYGRQFVIDALVMEDVQAVQYCTEQLGSEQAALHYLTLLESDAARKNRHFFREMYSRQCRWTRVQYELSTKVL